MSTHATSPHYVRIPTNLFSALRSSFADSESEGDGLIRLRRIGVGTADALGPAVERWIADRVGDEAPASVPADRFWELLAGYFEDLGWGALHHSQIHPGIGSLETTDWMEAEPADNLARPGCHITTGMLAELFRRIADEDVAVMEVECRSAGDERCRFLLGGLAALDALHADLLHGTPYDEALARLE